MVGYWPGPFEPNMVVPSQFFATLPRQAPSNGGEYRLLVALLKDAVERFQKHVLTGNRRFAEAAQWIMGEDADTVRHAKDQVPGFSFEYVCDVLGLDADYLRWGLQQWRTRSTQSANITPLPANGQ